MEEGPGVRKPEDQDVFWEIVSSAHDREAVPVKSQPHGCLNKINTMTTSADKPMGIKELFKALSLDEDLEAANGCREKN